MKLEQKNLLETLFNTLRNGDEIFEHSVTFTIEKTEINNWKLHFKKKQSAK